MLRINKRYFASIAVAFLSTTALACAAEDRKVPVGQAPDMTCADAAAKLKADQFADPDDKLVVSTKNTQCEVQGYNQRHANDPAGSKKVAYITQDPNDPKKVLFGILTLDQAKQANSLCKTLTGGFAAVAVPDADTSVLIGALGTMRCDQYFDLAVNNDPLLVVFPTMAPEARLTAQVIQAARDAVPKLAEYYKQHPQDIATVGINPAAQGRLLQQLGQAAGGSGGGALQHLGGELEKGVKKLCPRC